MNHVVHSYDNLHMGHGFHRNLLDSGFANGLLVGGFNLPLWKKKHDNSSVGMMKFPTEWKVIIHSCSSHHQPDISLTTINHY